MGASIYFCDICGVRITDADLRSGHGMLQAHDAICAGCIDLGHGKPWLEARQGAQAPTKTPLPETVKGTETIDKKDTVRMRTDSQDGFGQAALAMGAMASPPPPSTVESVDLSDPEPAVDSVALGQAGDLPKQDEEPDTEPTRKAAPPVNRKTPSIKRTPAKPPSGSTPKAKTTGREAAAAEAVAKAKKTQMIVTIIGVTIIIGCGLYVLQSRQAAAAANRPKGKVIDMADERNALSDQVRDVRKQADAAYVAKDRAKVQAAHEAMIALRKKVQEFNDLATKNGWSEEDVGVWADQAHVAEVLNKDKLLRDFLAGQK